MLRSRTLLTLAALCAIAAALIAWQWPALNAAGRHGLAWLYLQHGNALLKAGDKNAALPDFNEAIRLDPSIADAYQDRARVWLWQDNYGKAIADLSTLLHLEPWNLEAHYLRGYVFFKNGDYDKSISDYSQVIHRGSSDLTFSGYKRRAEAYTALGDFSKALADYDQAILLHPKGAAAYHDRAALYYYQMGDLNKSLADYDEAIRMYSNNLSYYAERARVLYSKGDYALASSDYQTGMKTLNDFHTFNDYAWFLATCPDPAYRDGKKAVEYAIKACDNHEWRKSSYINTLAAAYAETGDFEKAVSFESWYLTLKPGDKAAISRLELYKASQPYREPVKTSPAWIPAAPPPPATP